MALVSLFREIPTATNQSIHTTAIQQRPLPLQLQGIAYYEKASVRQNESADHIIFRYVKVSIEAFLPCREVTKGMTDWRHQWEGVAAEFRALAQADGGRGP